MATEKELTKLREESLKRPNPFKWSDYKKHLHKKMKEEILKNPKACDDCFDVYNKNDLYKVEIPKKGTFMFCKNCLCFG